ncbi:MAG TPA: 2-oxoglutarate dehydrogenase E1 component [Rhizomicrobium sp.]|jgi:2-oxoglutarate dehydrogenase E1 component|nr:2-oxoglutarate dehydrogenase E1 component [Rhizomicrobium sp.]
MTGPDSQKRLRDSNAILESTSFLSGANSGFIEELYARFLENPESVDPSWRQFFAELGERPASAYRASAEHRPRLRPRVARDDADLLGALTGYWPADGAAASIADSRAAARESIRAIQLVRAYRVIGHLAADLDPLKLAPKPALPQLDPEFYGFHASDIHRPVYINGVLGLETATPRQMVELLRRTYCGRIGYEFMHIIDPAEKDWLQRRIEGPDKEISFTPEGKRSILNKLVEAESFEKFSALRFVGTKRFGIDGGEAMIPALEQIIKRGGQLGVKEIVLGMSHRGRLNVLANVMAKPYRQIFHEFQGGSANPSDIEGSGDVKYHLGASSDREFDNRSVHLSLTPNPSHLEAVDPVVLGKARAKQQQLNDNDARASVLPLLIHGDAAFAGQGIVAECFAMSGTKGFRTGGTIHFIVNNQIGFTTTPAYARSSPYPSDVALMVQAPIFHVNGDDPEAVVHCARIATEFRQLFHKDVVIDMFCYRRFGHNETDEPSFTQPLMYRAIKDHPSTLALYAARLIAEGTLNESDVQAMLQTFNTHLAAEFEAAKTHRPDRADWLDGRWTGFATAPEGDRRGETAVPIEKLRAVGRALTTVPQDFHLHRTIARQLEAKARMLEAGEGIDWSTAEALAFGTLLDEGCPVRLSGQDSTRGTFSQRHAVLVDQETEARYLPLCHVREGQAPFEAIDSLLSEQAVVGFEYGFSSAEPRALVLWEAQFGDFANGAQVIIDQFIASGEMKWLRMCGLVLLLPHGYEGQGPEHSSARIERFLQLCAQDNMQVAYCTTPANYFHVLRRQVHRPFRKPLVLMTPKSLLRHKRVVSHLADFATGSGFHRILWDGAEAEPGSSLALAADNAIARVVLCTGKVYYDLFEEREKRRLDRIQLLRIEQLYPFPQKAIASELARFPKAEIVWCQEEPRNQGAWTFVAPYIHAASAMGGKPAWPRYIGRPEFASTASGLFSQHTGELHTLLDEALTL